MACRYAGRRNKGIEVLQIALASNREKRGGIIRFGVLTVIACVIAAFVFTSMQDQQARSLSQSTERFRMHSTRSG